MSLNIKKNKKVLFLFLFLGMILSCTLVNAALLPEIDGSVYVYETLKAPTSTAFTDVTDYYEKSEPTHQKIIILSASTSLNSPCEGCEIASRVKSSDGNYSSSLILTMEDGQQAWTSVTALPGEWMLQQRRAGVSLLKTTVSSIWDVE